MKWTVATGCFQTLQIQPWWYWVMDYLHFQKPETKTFLFRNHTPGKPKSIAFVHGIQLIRFHIFISQPNCLKLGFALALGRWWSTGASWAGQVGARRVSHSVDCRPLRKLTYEPNTRAAWGTSPWPWSTSLSGDNSRSTAREGAKYVRVKIPSPQSDVRSVLTSFNTHMHTHNMHLVQAFWSYT